MSCDRQRERVIKALSINHHIQSALGGPKTASEVLSTVYDVASNLPPPEDKIAQLAVAAGYSSMHARAGRLKIDLNPHKSKAASPPMQQGWAAISELITALEHGKPLSQLADDTLGSLSFEPFCQSGAGWCREFPSRTELRMIWADEPERVGALVRGEMGGPEHGPFLRELTRRVTTDPVLAAARPLAAAARHYLALDEAEALEPEQQARWARALGNMVGVGAAISWDTCLNCGDAHEGDCNPAERDTLPLVAAAVAVALTHPDTEGYTPDFNPHASLRQLLADAQKRAAKGDAPEWGPALLDAQRAVDMAVVANMAARGQPLSPRDRAILREATIRRPLEIDGQRYIWDTGNLYPEEVYRRSFKPGRMGEQYIDPTFVNSPLIPREVYLSETVAQMNADDLAAAISGPPALRVPLRWKPDELTRRYATTTATPQELREGDTVVDACGCVLSLVEQAGSDYTYERLNGSTACATHPPDTFTLRGDAVPRQRVEYSRPLFRLTWPAAAPSGGAR